VRSNVIGRPALSSWKQVLEYLNAAQSREHREQFRVLFPTKNGMWRFFATKDGIIDLQVAYYTRFDTRFPHR